MVIVLALGSQEYASIIGESELCVSVMSRIHLVVPSSINALGEFIIKLHCIIVCCSTYINSWRGLRFFGVPSDSPVLFLAEVTDI